MSETAPERKEFDTGRVEYRLKGQLHREDGPALVTAQGDKFWYALDVLHRVGGPAVECVNGTVKYIQCGLLHRLDGPACVYPDGAKEWWKDNSLHREGGPAVTGGGYPPQFWVNGKKIR